MPFKRTDEYRIPTTLPTAREADGHDTPAVEALVAELRSSDAARRSVAAARLQATPDAFASFVPDLLRDTAPAVRISTLTALASSTDLRLEGWLIDVLREDTDVDVCSAAVDLLGEVGTGASRQALEQLPKRFAAHPYIRFAVRVALERLTDG